MEINGVLFGLLIPFVGTTAGAACVFFLRKDLKLSVQRMLNGFAAGVMVAASIWSLIVPAIDQSAAKGRLAFLPAFLGFWIGIAFMLLLDHIIPHLHRAVNQTEGPKSRLARITMMFPEGAIISMPLYAEGKSKAKAFWLGLLSGAVEPVFGALTVLLVGLIVPAMPYLLSFAAGAMLYVVVEELIPEMSAGEHSNIGVIAFAFGFSLMMALDVALG